MLGINSVTIGNCRKGAFIFNPVGLHLFPQCGGGGGASAEK